MLVQEESLPKPNIYSSKVLFEQVDSRNKKRMAQMLKRKTALSAKNKSINKDFDELSLKESPIRPKIEDKTNNLIFINIIREKEININNIINPHYNNNQIFIDIKTSKEPEKEKEKEIITINNNINNKIKLDNSSAVSNIVNENNNYYNTSSTNNSNNNSILYKDSQEKEINISNLDNDSIDDIIINKDDEDNNHKNIGSNLYDYEKDDDNILTKEENKLKEENEFALKYLSSSSDSFVQLDNNLVAQAKAQRGDMTDSYFQALFPQLPLDNKLLKNKNYDVTEIIKEEKETETPLRIKNNNSRNSKDFSRGSRDMNLNLSNDNSPNSIIRFLKKSPHKYISNFKLYKKKTESIFNKKNKRNNLNEISNKSNLSFRDTKKIIKKNNTMSIITKNKKNKEKTHLNKTSSLSNLNISNCKKNKNNKSIFNSTFSSNINTNNKTEYKLNKNMQKKLNLKKSLNNLINNKNENDLNDTLICNYIKNIDKPKNVKITKVNMHYIKNINNYQKYKNLNKNIIKRNQDEYNLNKSNYDTTKTLSSLYTSKRNFLINDIYYKSLDLTKKRSILSLRNISNKNMKNKPLKFNFMNNYNNDTKINNINKDICHKYKNLNLNYSMTKVKPKIKHHQTSSSLYSTNTSIKINPKLKKNLSKYSRVKSVSKLSYTKPTTSSIYNSIHQFKRSQTHKKLRKINKNVNNESIILNSSFAKNIKNKNSSLNTTTTLKKKKFTTFYKKIDYSYVKPKVETGLSEIMIKKLLNNNKKLTRKQTNKKIETEKKQSIIKRCKITMNKTIENFKEMASTIKKKLFKGGNNEKNDINDDINITNTIHSCRNSKKMKNLRYKI